LNGKLADFLETRVNAVLLEVVLHGVVGNNLDKNKKELTSSMPTLAACKK
jgi:hypothetical protein